MNGDGFPIIIKRKKSISMEIQFGDISSNLHTAGANRYPVFLFIIYSFQAYLLVECNTETNAVLKESHVTKYNKHYFDFCVKVNRVSRKMIPFFD